MKELHQQYSEIGEIPIPLANEILKISKEENEKMEKQMKKGGKKNGR